MILLLSFICLVPKFEPAMPRRKKYPDLAYRHHEFLIGDGETAVMNGKCNNSGGDNRARVSNPLLSARHMHFIVKVV